MKSEDKAKLIETIGMFSKLRAAVIGDIILDRYVWGRVDRISPEAPVPVVSVQSNEDRLGGAANAANNFSALGIRTEIVGLVGEDSERESVFSLLRSAGISANGVITDKSRPSTLKTRVMGQKQQLLRIDRESVVCANSQLSELSRLSGELMSSADCVLISDYGKGVFFPEVLQIVTQRSLALGERAPIMALDPHPANYNNYQGFHIAKPNRKEAELASGIKVTSLESAVAAAERLRNLWGTLRVMISLSEDGLVVSGPEGDFHLPTIIRDVFDVSGAGDTLTTVVTAALATGANIGTAAQLGIIAASNVVGKLGTATIKAEELRHDVELLFAEEKIPAPNWIRRLGQTKSLYS